MLLVAKTEPAEPKPNQYMYMLEPGHQYGPREAMLPTNEINKEIENLNELFQVRISFASVFLDRFNDFSLPRRALSLSTITSAA